MRIGTETTYWNFITENGISIPIIQRDYAQGREGKEALRKRFLSKMKESLETESPLMLDFVYGMNNTAGSINPLDGQQRLTTLWLLHWYLLLKSSETEEKLKGSLKVLTKFTYETRLSSRSFCEKLCEEKNFLALREVDCNSIRENIENRTWFMAEWGQDPTVKAMLNMLGSAGDKNSIEGIFNVAVDRNKFWQLLKGDKCPIKFYYLSLDGEIAQSPDDIYIKMNARGEHLTDFENFKADLLKYVRDNNKDQTWSNEINEKDYTADLGLSKNIDDIWTNIFWNQLSKTKKEITNFRSGAKEKEAPSIDKQLFAFLNRYFINRYFIEFNGEVEKTDFFKELYGKKGQADINIQYTDFDLYKDAQVIKPEKFKDLIAIFKNIQSNSDVVNLLTTCGRPERLEPGSFNFFPEIDDKEKLKDIKQKQRIVFFGVCCYLESCNSFNKGNFKDWMRFVWNMSRNSDVESVDAMIKVLKEIYSKKGNSNNRVETLKNCVSPQIQTSYFDRQLTEEIKKAGFRFNNRGTEVDYAEKIFHGSINFLLADDLLSGEYVDKAKELIYVVDNKGEVVLQNENNGNIHSNNEELKPRYNKNWILEILPYIDEKKIFHHSKNEENELSFYDKTKDVEKIINYNDDIIDAVRRYLASPNNVIVNDSWLCQLSLIKDGTNSLFDYSNSKLIKKYFWWSNKESEPTGIYLYKTKQWKKDQCILLWSENKDTDASLKKRNNFIISKIKDEGYSLLIDEKVTFDTVDNEDYCGRPIVLKKNGIILYCGVTGYKNNSGSVENY